MAKVLVVDDSREITDLLVAFLSSEGHAAMGAVESRAIHALVEEHKPDLVILDYAMPGLDGVKTLAKLRAMPGWEALPVIFLSGVPFYQLTLKVDATPLVRYLTKPVDFSRLKGLIAELLERR